MISDLDIQCLLLFRQTCQRVDATVSEYLVYKLLALLARYVLSLEVVFNSISNIWNSHVADSGRLRNVLRSTGSIVGGSTALAFINPTVIPADLDIYTTSATAPTLVKHLCQCEGYIVDKAVNIPKSCNIQHLHYLAGICRITSLREGPRRVDIIESTGRSATTPVSFSWTSLQMNFIAADAFCCVFPNLTLNHCGVFVSERIMHASMPEGTHILPLEKYQQRGYTFFSDSFDWDGHLCLPWCCHTQDRFFGDAGCMLVEFAAISQ